MFVAGGFAPDPEWVKSYDHIAPKLSYLRKKGRGKEESVGKRRGNGRDGDYHPHWRYMLGSPAIDYDYGQMTTGTNVSRSR